MCLIVARQHAMHAERDIVMSNMYVCLSVCPGADLTGGHSCSGRRGPWEAGPWRPPGLGGPGRLNFGLELQSPDWKLN